MRLPLGEGFSTIMKIFFLKHLQIQKGNIRFVNGSENHIFDRKTTLAPLTNVPFEALIKVLLGSLKNQQTIKTMRRTLIIYYTTISTLMFHYSVSAQQDSPSFTATSKPALSSVSQSSKIISINTIINNKKVLLSWTVGENQQTDRFEVERSADGKKFTFAAMVFGTDKEGLDYYQFVEKLKKSAPYYRVKTVAKDGSVFFSKTINAGN